MPLALLAALAASVFTHAAALFMPGLDILPGGEEPQAVTLNAELQMPAPKPAAPKPKSHKPAHHPAAPQADAGSDNTTATPPNAAAPASESPPPRPSPPADSTQGSVQYTVYQGTNGFIVGRATHSWQFTSDHYELRSHTETAGLAGLFYPLRVDMVSSGLFGPDGLQPQAFQTLKNGQPTDENAEFDWTAHTVRLARDGRTRPLAAGSQDMLSFHFQLAYLAGLFAQPQGTFPMNVASGKRYDAYTFTLQGTETLDTPAGHFHAVHLRAAAPDLGGDATDVWLAEDYHWLAVKIRFTDRKGELFEQVIQQLDLGNKTP